MRRQLKAAAKQSWAIGVEPKLEELANGSSQTPPRANEPKFAELFMQWAPEAKSAI